MPNIRTMPSRLSAQMDRVTEKQITAETKRIQRAFRDGKISKFTKRALLSSMPIHLAYLTNAA